MEYRTVESVEISKHFKDLKECMEYIKDTPKVWKFSYYDDDDHQNRWAKITRYDTYVYKYCIPEHFPKSFWDTKNPKKEFWISQSFDLDLVQRPEKKPVYPVTECLTRIEFFERFNV